MCFQSCDLVIDGDNDGSEAAPDDDEMVTIRRRLPPLLLLRNASYTTKSADHDHASSCKFRCANSMIVEFA